MNFTMPDDTLDLVMMDLMRRLGQIHHSANLHLGQAMKIEVLEKRKRVKFKGLFACREKMSVVL